jgi:hypothetical protein
MRECVCTCTAMENRESNKDSTTCTAWCSSYPCRKGDNAAYKGHTNPQRKKRKKLLVMPYYRHHLTPHHHAST